MEEIDNSVVSRSKNLIPVNGGQDPAVDIFPVLPPKEKEELVMPDWVNIDVTLNDLCIVLPDPQPLITEFFK